MKKFKILMLVMFFAVALISTSGLFAGEKVVKSEKISKDAKTCYTCPMASCKTFSHKAGKCPKCGMALKKMDKKDCATKCDAKKAHKKCISKDHKKCCAKKDLKKCEGKKALKKCCDKKNLKKCDSKVKHSAAYTCPMASCKTFSDKPGKCSKCGMALKKIENKQCKGKMHKKHWKGKKGSKNCCAKKDLKKCEGKKGYHHKKIEGTKKTEKTSSK